MAKDKSLFVVRLMVSAWCSVAGFVLGYILKIGAQHLEAASKFTLADGIGTLWGLISNSLGHRDSHEL